MTRPIVPQLEKRHRLFEGDLREVNLRVRREQLKQERGFRSHCKPSEFWHGFKFILLAVVLGTLLGVGLTVLP